MEVERISTTLSMPLKEFKQWLKEETADALQPFNKRGKELVDKVKERLSDAHEACEKLAEEGNKEIEKRKAVRKAKATEKLSRFFLKQIGKVDFPDEMSFSELDRLHKDLEKMVSSIGRERNVWFSRISPLFIIARKRVDFAFSRLAGSISELGGFLSGDYSKARAVENLFFETDELFRLLDELGRFERREAVLKEKAQSFERKIEAVERRLSSVKDDAGLGDLSEVKQEIKRLKKQVRYDLRHLEKPFLKFANLKGGSGFALSGEEAAKLGEYLEDPFLGLATEKSGYPVLKGLLKKMELAMDERRLKLKSSRLRKARDKIDEVLNNNALDELYLSCTRAFSSSQQLRSSEEMQVARRKVKRLERRLRELHRRKKAVDVRLDDLEKKREELLEMVEEQKSGLEGLVFKVLEKRVSIEL
jgi:hypothetical protein